MRKFVVIFFVCFSSVLSLFCWAYILNHPSLESKKAKSNQEPFIVVNLGSSHGGSFDHTLIPCNSKGFHISANNLYYDLQTYLALVEKDLIGENAVIILPLSFYYFGADENHKDWNENFTNRFYFLLKPHQIIGYSILKDFKLKFEHARKNILSFFRKKSTKSKHKSQVWTDNQNENWEKHMLIFNENRIDKNYKYLQQLLLQITNHGHRPLLLTTPYHREYHDNYESTWLRKNYYQFIDSIRLEKNIPYLNFSTHPKFANDTSLFLNSDHLNEKGKKLFTQLFLMELDKNKISLCD